MTVIGWLVVVLTALLTTIVYVPELPVCKWGSVNAEFVVVLTSVEPSYNL